MKVAAGERCIWKCRLKRLHEGKLVVTLDDSRLKTRTDRTHLPHDAFIKAIVLGRHADVHYRNANSAVGHHQVEELRKRARSSPEGGVTHEVNVVGSHHLQDIWTGQDDGKVLRPIVLNISDGSLANWFDFLQAVF